MADNEFSDQSQPDDRRTGDHPGAPENSGSSEPTAQSSDQQQTAGQPYPGQPYPAAPYSGQPYPAAQYPGQQYSGQPYPEQAYPRGEYSGAQYSGQQSAGPRYPGQQYPGGQYPTAEYPPTGYAEAGYGVSSATPRYGGWGAPGPYDPAGPTAGGQPPSAVGPPTAGDATGAKPVRRGRALPVIVAVLLAALIGGAVGAITVAVTDRRNGTVNTGLTVTNNTAAPNAQADGTIGAAAAKIRPSVVTINESSGQSGGTGSGVILRPDGYILTNDHVISLAAQGGSLQATLSDGRTAKATIVGRDTSDDLAVIKVSGLSNLTAATFGKSSSLTVGQTVVAVGAPLGLSDTVTSGIVSNTARPVRAGDNDQAVFQAIQTDAAINPGNSGGPLVDLNGSVVGINAAIATDNSGGGLQIPGQTQQSGNIGIGFAIPADEASRIASELIANGKAYHAVLGVSVKSASSSTTAGVTLASVRAGSGAATAGLKVGDLITAVDGRLVTTADSLIAAIRSYAPGSHVQITYSRGGASEKTTVTLDKSSQ
jgi:putative serine protease PepD